MDLNDLNRIWPRLDQYLETTLADCAAQIIALLEADKPEDIPPLVADIRALKALRADFAYQLRTAGLRT
jgi:hypothetical protein